MLSAAALRASARLLPTVRSQQVRTFQATALALEKLNVEGLASRVDLEGQNVLLRVDLNVPLSKEVSLTRVHFKLYGCKCLRFSFFILGNVCFIFIFCNFFNLMILN